MASSSPQPSSRRERTEKTRESVLAVATDLMASRGYSGTTISAISKASGVMPASIYWHFESKEGLLAAVIERAAEAWFDGALHAMEQGEQEQEQRSRSFEGPPDNRRALHYVLVERADFYRVLMLIALERQDAAGPPIAAVKRIRERIRERLTEKMEGRLGEHLGLEAGPARQQIAARLTSIAMVQLDGTFLEQQLDPAEGADLDARFDRIGWVLSLARDALLREAGLEVSS